MLSDKMSIGGDDDLNDFDESLHADLRDMAAISPGLMTILRKAGAEEGKWHRISVEVMVVHDEISMAGMTIVPSAGFEEDV